MLSKSIGLDKLETTLALDIWQTESKSDFFTEEIILSAYWKIRDHFTMDFTEWNHDVPTDPSYVDFGDSPDEAMLKKRFYTLWDDLKTFA